jgi:hypothetical protein
MIAKVGIRIPMSRARVMIAGHVNRQPSVKQEYAAVISAGCSA